MVHLPGSERSTNLCKATNRLPACKASLENHRGSGFLNVSYYPPFQQQLYKRSSSAKRFSLGDHDCSGRFVVHVLNKTAPFPSAQEICSSPSPPSTLTLKRFYFS